MRRPLLLGAAALAAATLALGAAHYLSAPQRHRAPPRAGPPPAPGRSCGGAPGADHRCGASGDVDCCDRRAVPGGTSKRGFDGAGCRDDSHPATVSGFALDTHEITVGRFRAFVAAGRGTATSPPAPGDGEHPKIPGSGWDPSWNGELARDTESLTRRLRCHPEAATWTDVPGDKERLPINCLSFHEAFAFCAWDGGRLPTEAEWSHAAAGGAEQRLHAWSRPPGALDIDERHAVFSQPRAAAVGSRSPLGDARWGHADLNGNVWEWTLDTADPRKLLPTQGAGLCPSDGLLDPCVDCASLDAGPARVARSGGYGLPRPAIINALRRADTPGSRFPVLGARCAHDLGGPAPPTYAVVGACLPRCEGRSCGSDGCGGTCGACPGGASCDDEGRCSPASYPPGPHGCEEGAVIPDLALTGFVDPTKGTETTTPVRLGDLHNPSGQASFAPGSPFGGGRPKPRALALHLGATWSERAGRDAREVLGPLRTRIQPRGGEVLSLLIEGARRGQPADAHDVVAWARANEIGYPALMDPGRRAEPCFGRFPALVVIDARTMRVVAVGDAGEGAPLHAFEALLSAP